MNRIFLFFLAVCIFSCNQRPNEKRVRELSDSNVTPDEIVFIFKNEKQNALTDNNRNLLESEIYYTEEGDFIINELSPKNTNSSDTLTVLVNANKISLSYKYNKIKKNIYEFQKGDTVVFDYDKGLLFASVLNRKTLKFDNNLFNNLDINKPLDLFEFVKKNKRLRNKIESETYLDELSIYTKKVNKFLDSVFQKGLLSKSNYVMYKGYNDFFEINTNSSLLNDVKENDLKRDELLYLKTYRHFLNKYAVHRFKLKTKFINDPLSCDSRVAFDSIDKSFLFSKRVKESLLYSQLINIANTKSDQDFKKYYERFQTIVKDTTVINKVKNNYLLDFTSLKEEIKEVYLTNLIKENQTFANLISKNKGKVIYVDFWASWCAPCIKQMPSSKELKKEYKDEDVVFLYLSIDKDFEKWRAASSKLKLFDNSFLVVNYFNANYFKELKFQNIPRYLIYDKQGRLTHQNAPDPSSLGIREELNKFLSK